MERLALGRLLGAESPRGHFAHSGIEDGDVVNQRVIASQARNARRRHVAQHLARLLEVYGEHRMHGLGLQGQRVQSLRVGFVEQAARPSCHLAAGKGLLRPGRQVERILEDLAFPRHVGQIGRIGNPQQRVGGEFGRLPTREIGQIHQRGRTRCDGPSGCPAPGQPCACEEAKPAHTRHATTSKSWFPDPTRRRAARSN